MFFLVITCAVPTISDATNDCTASAAFSSTCTVTCNTGYLISGSASITCGDDNGDGTGDYANQPTCGSKYLVYYQVDTFNIMTS